MMVIVYLRCLHNYQGFFSFTNMKYEIIGLYKPKFFPLLSDPQRLTNIVYAQYDNNAM